ncbi:thiosulfate sulfurtransferase [Gluconobacter oxydans]|nr:thiosulfate sulfurtransferase [Gluconobacter oxydans H24]ANQ43130.1 thiosulfate sulfurtransferase [Gluconobacter oxydans]
MTNSPLLAAQDLLAGTTAYVSLDASVLLPGQNGNPDAAFREARIPGARRFDIDVFADPESSLPHTVPGAARFARLMGELGLTEDTPIVFYDEKGSVGACRGWWLARLFGHRTVRILDGGLKAWQEAGGTVEHGEPAPVSPARYRTRPRYGLLAGSGDILEAPAQTVVLDARSHGRFTASVPEPRPGGRGGHMAGAISMDWARLVDEHGHFLPQETLRSLFVPVAGRRVITSCGSGLTAATLLAGLAIAGLPDGALYDGSWAEWGSDPDAPIVTGEQA